MRPASIGLWRTGKVTSTASAAMALSLGGEVAPLPEIAERLREGLRLMAAGSWSPEDQDPAD